MATARNRIDSLDALRGVVMVVMALDHVRDMFHRGAMNFSPTDLSKTTPLLFFTRWVTHFCMPTFMFAAGAGVYLWGSRRARPRTELSRYLLMRGIWFAFLEVTVMQFSYDFGFSSKNLLLLLVLWIFGLCMIAMSALVWLPIRLLAVLSIATILLHNLLDNVPIPVWTSIHQPGVFQIAGRTALVSYPLIPWVAVMAAGFCFGPVFSFEPQRRRTLMLRMGAGLTLAFLVIRTLNVYGDPSPRVAGVLSFLNCTKYPPSLEFLLMTLGPMLIGLSCLDRRSFDPRNPLIVFGRVPLLYFVLHFFLIHLTLAVASWMHYGNAAFGFIFNPVPSFGGPANLFPPDFGYRLRTVYVVWLVLVALLYPICRWFAGVKARGRYWWLRYL